MAMSTSSTGEGEVMVEMNTTPLIDVMLVLLTLLIITLPIQTHAVKLDLPVNQPNQAPPPIDPIKNVVGINAQNQILWNGSPVSEQQLRQYLDITQQMNPIPELHLQPDAGASARGRSGCPLPTDRPPESDAACRATCSGCG